MRKVFGSKREEVTQEAEENCVMRSFIICSPCQILLG
jgi:hypothetical protein